MKSRFLSVIRQALLATMFVIPGVCLMIAVLVLPSSAQTARDPFRQPLPSAVPAALVPAPHPFTHRLIGVIIVGKQQAAIFHSAQDGQIQIRRAGEEINGRRIKHIGLDKLVYGQEEAP